MGANPERPIACDEKVQDNTAWESFVRGRLPRDGSDTIEPQQAEFRAQPEITIGRLGNCPSRAFGKTVAYPPRSVGILADVQ
jgi:hypothetical protein